MAKQLDKKWIGDNQVDGEKIQLEYGQSIKAKNSSGVEQDLIKVGASGEVLVGASNEEVAKKSVLDQEILDRASGDASTLSSANSYTDGEVLAEENARIAAISSVEAAIAQEVLDRAEAVGNEQTRAEAAELALQNSIEQEAIDRGLADSALQSQIDAISGGGSGSLAVLQGELDDTQAGAGLDMFGDYVPATMANYISGSLSIHGATVDLDSALKVVDEYAVAVESRVTVAEADITSLEGRMTTAEGDIDSLEGRMTTAESDIGILEGRMDTAEADIVALEGRMTSAESDIADLQTEDTTFLKLDGSRPMQANLNMMDGPTHYKIVGLADPVDGRDAVNKQYVDAISEGLHVHAPAKVLINAPISGVVTYDNGASGVGATLTLGTAITSVDTYSLQNGDRIIVNGQANEAHNGIYTWATGGTVLTRASDFDNTIEVAGGDFIFVQEGSQFANTGWVMSKTTTAIGTSPIVFIQFSGAGTYTAGDALSLTGGEFNTLYDNSTIGVNGSNQLFLKDISISTGKLVDASVTKEKIASDVAGNGLGQNANGSLEVKVDGASLEIASDIVQVKDDGITKEKIASDVAGTGLQQNANGSLEIKLDGSSLSVSASGLKINIASKKEEYAITSTLSSGAFFDLAFVAEVDSVIAHVDRVAIHEGAAHDYSVSYTGGAGGNTRIYFLNALVTPGQQQLSNGDTVFFKYERKVS